MVFKESSRSTSPLFSIFIGFIALNILITNAHADCGCGARCMKYSTDLQCTRCCTATVRRSVPVIPPDDVIDPNESAKVYDIQLPEPVEKPVSYIIPRSSRLTYSSPNSLSSLTRPSKRNSRPNSELISQIIENLVREERRVRSERRRRTLQKARERLQFYQRMQSRRSSEMSISSAEKEMFDLLESILTRIRVSESRSSR